MKTGRVQYLIHLLAMCILFTYDNAVYKTMKSFHNYTAHFTFQVEILQRVTGRQRQCRRSDSEALVCAVHIQFAPSYMKFNHIYTETK